MADTPGLFSDFGNQAKDLLTKDFISDHKFSISTCTGNGVALTSTTVKKGGLSTGDVGVVYKCKKTAIDVKLDTDSNIATTFTITDILPSTKTIASLKIPHYSSGKLEVQYFHDHATFTSAFALNKSPVVDATATLGTRTIAFGVEAGYDTKSGAITKYTAGIRVSKPQACASIILGDKGETVKASYIHHFDQLKRIVASAEISRRFSANENTFIVGGSYVIDNLTVVKAKLDNHGKLGAVLQHEVIPKSMLTIASEIDTLALDKTPRFGLALALKP